MLASFCKCIHGPLETHASACHQALGQFAYLLTHLLSCQADSPFTSFLLLDLSVLIISTFSMLLFAPKVFLSSLPHLTPSRWWDRMTSHEPVAGELVAFPFLIRTLTLILISSSLGMFITWLKWGRKTMHLLLPERGEELKHSAFLGIPFKCFHFKFCYLSYRLLGVQIPWQMLGKCFITSL